MKDTITVNVGTNLLWRAVDVAAGAAALFPGARSEAAEPLRQFVMAALLIRLGMALALAIYKRGQP